MKQRILILGSGGFVGQNLIARLRSSDWAIPIGAVHRPIGHGPANETERVVCEATDADEILRASVRVDGIVNCVAGSSNTIVANAKALATSMSKLSRCRVVHISSIAAYGSTIGMVDESARLLGDIGAYSSAKADSDRILSEAGAVVFRPGIIYGPGSRLWSERIGKLLMQRRLGDLGAAGDGYCNAVYVDDVASAVLRALQNPAFEGEAFNLATSSSLTWNDYFVQYARALRATPVNRLGPLRLAIESKIAAVPLKILELTANRLRLNQHKLPPPIPQSFLKLFKHEIQLLNNKAEALLEIDWTSLDDGLTRSADDLHRATGWN